MINEITYLCIFIFGLSPSILSQELILIIHKDSRFKSIATKDIKYIFLGKLKKIKDLNIIPITLKIGKVHDIFFDKFIKKNARQFSRFLKKLLFTGRGKPPKSYKSK
ncbi:MAG: hypothetical protein COA79_19925 [Planctomycetota bacterium]|nr:MAG: hypothetical protein COA79_19925 [Planctomycetota bacterium]